MRIRLLAGGAALWAVAYLFGYGWVIDHLHASGPAWWYVALVSVVVLLLIAVAAGRAGRRALIGALVILALSAFVGIMTIGFLLLPAIIAVTIALMASPRPGPGSPPVARPQRTNS